MRFFAAGLVAAVFAYAANRLSYRAWGNVVLIGPGPLVEEVAKTMTATLFGTAILYAHIVFGAAEAFLDWHGKKKGFSPAASAFMAHTVFGLVTSTVYRESGILGLGMLSAFLLHASWNMVLLYRTAKR